MPNMLREALDEDFASGTDSSSDEEEESQDVVNEIFGETAADRQPRSTPTHSPNGTPTKGDDTSVIVMNEEEEESIGHGTARRRVQLKGQQVVKVLVKMNSNTMGALINSQKRAPVKEKKYEQPEEPIKVVWSEEGEKLEDDNHSQIAWRCRRLYKQPNMDPKAYWEKAGYTLKVSPNLKDSLYLRHLMPMSLSSKALSWGHNLVAMTAIKYFTHSQASSSAKKRKTEFSVEED